MAIEDAFILATLLKESWTEPDGHIEAFYQYEVARKRHCAVVHRESWKQVVVGLVGPLTPLSSLSPCPRVSSSSEWH